MKKKILSLILVAAMLASMLVFAPAAGAATEAKVTVDVTETAGVAGDIVTVDILVKTDSTLAGYQQLIEYDKTRLELVKNGDLHHTGADFWLFSKNLDTASYFVDTVKNGGFLAISDAGMAEQIDGYEYDATNGQIIATEFLKTATLTFKIKDDAPVGDAYVASRYVDTNTWVTTVAGTSYSQPGEVEYIEGKVSVLPEGYQKTEDLADPAEFEYVANDDGTTCTIVEYLGTAKVLNIPTEIDGLTVTGIGKMIFCDVDHDTLRYELKTGTLGGTTATYRIGVTRNDTVETIIIPDTVKTIAELAFAQANALTKVVVVGDSLESVDVTAFGFKGGTWNGATRQTCSDAAARGTYKYDGVMTYAMNDTGDDYVYDEDYNAYVENLVIVQDREGTLTAKYDIYLGLGENDDGLFSAIEREYVSGIKAVWLNADIGGTPVAYYVVGSKVLAPAADGVVAWTDAEGNVYAPGADIGDVTELTAVTVEAPVTNKGVTAKITNEFAMRFQATISKATYDAMAELGEVTMGMLITPRQYVVKAGNVFTMEALDALVAGKGFAGYVRVDVQNPYSANAETFEECTEFTIAGSITGLKDSTAAKDPDFVSVGFLQVTRESGAVVTVYSDYNYTNAMKVSTFLDTVDTDGLGTTELGWINAWKKKYPAIFPDVE